MPVGSQRDTYARSSRAETSALTGGAFPRSRGHPTNQRGQTCKKRSQQDECRKQVRTWHRSRLLDVDGRGRYTYGSHIRMEPARPISRKVYLTKLALLAGAAFAVAGLVRAAHSYRGALAEEQNAGPARSRLFKKRDVMIPVRDDVKLHTEIYAPKNAHEPLPILLTRTPYGLDDDKNGFSRDLELYREMFADGYIFAFQDIRGRYGSEGHFIMNRVPRDRSDPKAIDETTDTYDTVGWLVKNVPGNNGRVGEAGISYGGWLTTMALLDPHPALKAVSEQASPADMFLGDDFHHNGAFRLSYGFEYAALLETSKENYSFKFSKADLFDWYLTDLGPLANANALYFHGKLPTWDDFVNHPNYDQFWQKQAFAPHIGAPKVPNLNVAGWWDQEDFYGPVKIYELFEKNDPGHLNYLVAGPWNHGGWAGMDGGKLGAISFDS